MEAILSQKLVIIGDGSCGKTSLLLAYLSSQKKCHFNPEPTVLDTCVLKVELNKNIANFVVWDTAGQEDYEKLRPLTYKNSDLIIVCYSIDNPESLENVIEKWYPELRYFCPSTPLILVGNKKDIRDHINIFGYKYGHNSKLKKSLLSREEGEHMAKRIRAHHFFECSSRTGEHVSDVFETAAIIVMINSKLKDLKKSKFSIKRCSIL